MIQEYYQEGEAIKCVYCDSDDIEIEVVDRIEYTVTESYKVCTKCNRRLSFWAYGHNEPGWARDGLRRLLRRDTYQQFRKNRKMLVQPLPQPDVQEWEPDHEMPF